MWATPKRCSSSMTTSPRSLNATSFCTRRCVPMHMSTLPLARALDHGPLLLPRPEAAQHVDSHRVGAQALGEGDVVLLGQHSGRSQDGHLFASITALNAALSATSVLPYPTSPHTSRSMGRARSISPFTATMVSFWSGVSSNGNESSNSTCHGPSPAKLCPSASSRAAYRATSSGRHLSGGSGYPGLARFHSWLPSRVSEGGLSIGAT